MEASVEGIGQSARETQTLLRRRKRQVAQAILAGEETPVGELLAISKLELQLDNLTAFERLREMTRRPPPAPKPVRRRRAKPDAG